MQKEGLLVGCLFREEISGRSTIIHDTTFYIFKKRFNPLNKIRPKSKCSEGEMMKECSTKSNAFSKSAENKMASISFSFMYSRMSLIKRTDYPIFLLPT